MFTFILLFVEREFVYPCWNISLLIVCVVHVGVVLPPPGLSVLLAPATL